MLEQEVKKIICEVFQLDEEKLPEEISTKTIAQWDSVNHLRLIMELETRFDITFSSEDISHLTSLNAIVDKIKEVKKS